jgi:hypothetical protein
VRLSAFLMILGLVGVLIGAAIIGATAFGLAVIADSVALVAYGLLRDVPTDAELYEVNARHEARRQAA